MKAILVAVAVATLLVLASAVEFSYPKSDYEPDAKFTAFQDYVVRFGKKYQNVEEFTLRYSNFLDSLERVAKLNKDGRNVYGVTKFSDMSPAEFKKQYLGFNPTKAPKPTKAKIAPAPKSPNATSADWRDKGAVTAVKDQQQCGSCWAFSATEQIESNWFLAGNDLIELSPQQIVSCDTTDAGCSGGWTTSAYQYVQGAGGLDLDSDYPYTSGAGDSGTCDDPLPANPTATISGFSYAIPPCQDDCTNQDEDTMADVLAATSPLSICVDAETWQDYSSGILSDNCPSAYTDLDHCVQAVGFDTTGTTPYWIVRNSWNTDWGEEGFIRIAMGSNLCGVGDLATYVDI